VCDLTRWDEATGFLPNDTALGYRDGSTLLLRNELALFLLFHFALTVACRVALLPKERKRKRINNTFEEINHYF
jgi:hypothetical protein